MILIDYHCDYSHNCCVKFCELGLDLVLLSRTTALKTDTSLVLFIPVPLIFQDTARPIQQPNYRMGYKVEQLGLISTLTS